VPDIQITNVRVSILRKRSHNFSAIMEMSSKPTTADMDGGRLQISNFIANILRQKLSNAFVEMRDAPTPIKREDGIEEKTSSGKKLWSIVRNIVMSSKKNTPEAFDLDDDILIDDILGNNDKYEQAVDSKFPKEGSKAEYRKQRLRFSHGKVGTVQIDHRISPRTEITRPEIGIVTSLKEEPKRELKLDDIEVLKYSIEVQANELLVQSMEANHFSQDKGSKNMFRIVHDVVRRNRGMTVAERMKYPTVSVFY
jgi:hypothetical protein